MKLSAFILGIGITGSLISCGHSNPVPVQPTSDGASAQASPYHKEQEKSGSDKRAETEEMEDSIRMKRILDQAVAMAYQNRSADTFARTFESVPDSLYSVTITLKSGRFFSENFKHLIIHRKSPGTVYMDIYLQKGDTFEKVTAHEQWLLEYTTDTLQDVNGDGWNDFLVNWYGSTGCCLKNFYDVYLFHPEQGTFSKPFVFINPTFSPAEKMIRGVEYGHPGETELYKYKWNGWNVDTIESIYYETNKEGLKTGKVIREQYPGEKTRNKQIQKLDGVPKEYKRIYGFYWFAGNI